MMARSAAYPPTIPEAPRRRTTHSMFVHPKHSADAWLRCHDDCFKNFSPRLQFLILEY
jgi:hypothetical protein